MMKPFDLTTRKFGRLTPIELVDKQVWLCKCDCGKETRVRTWHLTGKKPVKSCGCWRSERAREMQKANCRLPQRRDDLTGKQFGRLTVVSPAESRKWLCKCECGNECETFAAYLRRAIRPKRSCGCLSREYANRPKSEKTSGRKKSTKTTKSTTPRKPKVIPPATSLNEIPTDCLEWLRLEYDGMYRRCNDDNHPCWVHFGGSGVKLKFDDFESFGVWVVANLGARSPGTKLIRISKYGDIGPNNLKWAS